MRRRVRHGEASISETPVKRQWGTTRKIGGGRHRRRGLRRDGVIREAHGGRRGDRNGLGGSRHSAINIPKRYNEHGRARRSDRVEGRSVGSKGSSLKNP